MKYSWANNNGVTQPIFVRIKGNDIIEKDRLIILNRSGTWAVYEWQRNTSINDAIPNSPTFATLCEAKAYYIVLAKLKYGIVYDV